MEIFQTIGAIAGLLALAGLIVLWLAILKRGG